MNDVHELERQIAARLHGHSRLAPDSDGWEAILDRIEHRGRARARRRAATTGLVMVGMVGSLGVLTTGDDARVTTTPAPSASTGGGPVSSLAPGGLPRLVLGELDGFEMTHASATDAEAGAGGRWPDLGPLLVYAFPAGDGDALVGPGPVLFARLVPVGASYGIGAGPEVKKVDVAGRPGRLLASGPGWSLGWPREDGSLVHLIQLGIADDDFLAAGRAIEGALAAGQTPPATLPGGVELRRTTESDTTPAGSAEINYRSGSRSVALRLTSGSTNRLDNLLVDRLASSGGWRPATVGGRPAVLSTYRESTSGDQPRTLMWAISDGVVAELATQGLTETEIEAAASSIHEVGQPEWDELLARSAILQSIPDPDEAAQTQAVSGMATEMCQARNAWLKARDAGDPAVEAASVAEMEAVLEKGQAADLGQTGDIVVVAERLLAAMAAGDPAAVSSIPEGGACS